jgi:hypothetical protein
MNSSPNESVSGELHVPQDPDVDPPVDLESDDVNVVQRNPRDTPPPETLAEALNDLNSSQDLPLQDADLVRLQEFRTKWFDAFTADSYWQDFPPNARRLLVRPGPLPKNCLDPSCYVLLSLLTTPLHDDRLMVD